jgi:hypothetical protein
MEKKEFLVASGMLVTTAMLGAFALDSSGASSEIAEEGYKNRRPHPNDFKEPILKAITLGLNAPNPHNTQAWKFKVINELEALLFVDEKKILPATDPPARQIHIGCGSFVAMFRMGASSLGYTPQVEYLPQGEYSFSEIGNKPVARLTVVANSVNEDPLFKHIYERQTNRGLYSGNLITEKEFNIILERTTSQHCEIKLCNDPVELPSLLELLYKGMEVECNDWNAYDESRQWFRVKDDIAEKKDGINLRTGGMKGLKRWIAETMLNGYSKKAWHNKSGIENYLKTYHEVVLTSKGVVTFTTANNQLIDWLKCGEDYARFQLAAYDQGFFIHPLSQVLQEFASMKKLHDEFNSRMKVNAPSKVQMPVRIGRGSPLEYSYRKNTSDFIV